MVSLMCGGSLKDRERNVGYIVFLRFRVWLYGRLRWFGHLEHNSVDPFGGFLHSEREHVDDWVQTCKNVVVAGGENCGQGQ